MSEDEIFVVIANLVIAVVGLAGLVPTPSLTRSWTHRRGPSLLILIAVGLACALLYFVLRRWASFDVRDSSTYLFFYMTMGLGTLSVMRWSIGWCGLHFRDDIAERGNMAAAVLLSGMLIGATAAFAGGNIGDGPGWWVVVFCALLSCGSLLLVWVFLNQISGAADAILIDRDVASAIRIGGLFIALGLVAGRAVAGDWVSVEVTTADFLKIATPMLALVVVDSVLHRFLRPSPQTPRPSPFIGLLPATVYVAAAVLYIGRLGSW